ncbi:50S ribosomal protein L24 [Acidobacteria bacterium Mor1]|nr:50S ribosomal protein L24 [Acidobacteria bacterium Mor1]
MPKCNVHKDDMVVVISGKDRDRTEPKRVLRVYPKTERVLVEGVNVIKRHTRPNPQQNIKGGIVERESPIHMSNVMVVDPETGRPTRVGRKRLEDGRWVRVAKQSGAVLDKKK